MAISIYEVSDYNVSVSYVKHDVVKSSTSYYYAIKDVGVGIPVSDTSYWGGYTTYFSQTKPSFVWQPSYSSTVNHVPRVKYIAFGDGYEQRVADGINNSLMDLDLTFELRSYKESFAILHFLYCRAGQASFVWIPPPPYSSQKIFICKEWTHVELFRDNHTIKARFLERVN